MAENPFQGVLNPNLSRGANLWDLRMMSAANRMETPFERGMRGSYGGRSATGDSMLSGMANEPDYSGFTYDPVMRQQAINAGVQPLEANQVHHNAILPNTGFFGRHPRLSGAIEGGLFAGLASHGGMTTGESIQGVLEGIVGGHRIQQGLYRQQFARPFEAAGMIEGLRDQAQRRELQSMDIEHLRAENLKLGRPDHDFRAFGVSRNDPNIATVDSTTGEVKTTPNPTYDPNSVGGNTPEEQFFSAKRAEARAAGVAPGPKVIASWNKEWADSRVPPEHDPQALVAIPDGKGGVTYQKASPGKHFTGTPMTPSQAGGAGPKADAARDKWLKDNSSMSAKNASIWMAAGVSPGDKDATKKLSAFYDSNISPYLSNGSQAAAPEAVGQGTQQNPYIIP